MARALGRYELLRPLARGGMAEVYLARRRAAGVEKWLVVKRMRPERCGDPRFLDLFVREARLSMSLVHQNIVPVFDFGRIDEQVFLAMERVEGKDLGSSLARAASHRMPPLLAAFIAAECCQALDYAHQRKAPDGVALGIVHRDVTPRNVLLSWSGEVKLTDFGIAALAGDATSRLLGTPQYMAPEQARSEPIDPRADIYALGLVLREAITGQRPRPGNDRETILDAARRGELVPWSSRSDRGDALALGTGDDSEPPPADDTAPAALIDIVERASAAAAADRYPDARSMLEDLDAFIVAQRAAHRADSPARQLGAWLAGVWDGARDDDEADAAIEGGHLVSFLDDGALDVVGTGTMRSMAATAAEDAHGDPAATAPAAAPTTPAPTTPPPLATPTLAAVIPVRPEGPRSSRISSSTSTVASGSFHTPPTSHALRARERARKVRALAPATSLVLVALAAGGGVFWVMNDRRAPRVANPPAALGPAAFASGSSTAVPAPAPPASGADAPRPAPPAAVVSRAASDVAPARDTPGRATEHDRATPRARRAIDGPDPGAHSPAAVAAALPGAGAPAPEHASPDPPPPNGSASGHAGSDHARPTICRVRLNLTPWAYFTTDTESTRHETPAIIELTPGTHRLHVWNPELHVERDIVLDVPADRDTMSYSEPLQPSSLPPSSAPR